MSCLFRLEVLRAELNLVFAPEVLISMTQGHDAAVISDHRVHVQPGRNRGKDLARQSLAESFPGALGEAQDGRSVANVTFLPEVQQ